MKPGAFLLAAVAGCGGASSEAPVVVAAAASLREVVTEATAGAPVRLRFDASSMLARQIREGAQVDLFVTAAPEWLDGLAPLDRLGWISNRLVVVVPREAPEADWRTAASLVMANEHVPAGKYARAALASLGVAPRGRIILGSSVRDVLGTVSHGGAAAGIVYATDAAADPRVRSVFTFPEESHPPIVYEIGVLTERGRATAARLRSPEGLAAARRRGFAVRE